MEMMTRSASASPSVLHMMYTSYSSSHARMDVKLVSLQKNLDAVKADRARSLTKKLTTHTEALHAYWRVYDRKGNYAEELQRAMLYGTQVQAAVESTEALAGAFALLNLQYGSSVHMERVLDAFIKQNSCSPQSLQTSREFHVRRGRELLRAIEANRVAIAQSKVVCDIITREAGVYMSEACEMVRGGKEVTGEIATLESAAKEALAALVRTDAALEAAEGLYSATLRCVYFCKFGMKACECECVRA